MLKRCLKLNILKLVLLFVLFLGSMGSWASRNPDWARDFYGEVRFQLTDDPEFLKQQGQLQYLEAELNRLKNVISQKQLLVQQKNQARQNQANELQQNQNAIAAKSKTIDDSQKELPLQKSKSAALDSSISANEQLVQVKTSALAILNTQLLGAKDKLGLATIETSLKQKSFDDVLAQCQAANPTLDCVNNDAQVALARQKLGQAKDLEKNLSDRVTRLSQQISDSQKAIETANSNLIKARQEKNKTEARIVELNTLIANLTAELPSLNDKSKTLSAQIATLDSQLASLNGELVNLTNIARQQGATYERHFYDFNQMREKLIADILAFNRQGRMNAQTQGSQEGVEIASVLGTDRGDKDGTSSGLVEGENAGRSRDYQEGQALGNSQGTRRGQDEGTFNGRNDGTRDGNSDVGMREGQISGIAKADRSDAASVGEAEGRQAGTLHASKDGQIQGTARGEGEAITKMESQTLSSVSVNGQFSGAFSSSLQTPYFPGTSHKYYNENVNTQRSVLRLAYIEGYRSGYDFFVERTYYDNFQGFYAQAFDRSRASAYAQAFGRKYADSFESGRVTQERISFDRQYKPSYSAAYSATKNQALQSPDRSSIAFKNAFQSSEISNYNSRYAEIKKASFEKVELETYNQNIATQIENFRVKRLGEVVALYNNFPVLKFISSTVSDAGINGVAGNDGIFQPGEKVLHEIIITNFSSVAASGVKVIATNGQVVTLPSIAGKSVVTIKGAILDQVPASAAIGSRFLTTLSAQYSLSSKEKNIQGRFFDDLSSGVLKSSSQNIVDLRFPMELSLSLLQPLAIGTTSSVSAKILNKSKRSFVGPLTLELTSSLGSSIVKTVFSDVDAIETSVIKNDARIMIDDSSQIFSDVDFSLVIKQSGVVLGKIGNVARDYVRTSYVKKAGAPVVVLKSTTLTSRALYKDLVSELGGVDQVSVIDLTAGTTAQELLENATEMNGKTLIVVNDNSNPVVSQLNKVFALKNVAVVFLADSGTQGSLAKAQLILANLKGSTNFPLSVDGQNLSIVSSSVVLNQSLGSQVSAIEVGMKDLDSFSKIVTLLKLSTTELLDLIGKSVSAETFFAQGADVKLLGKMAIMRNLEEVMALNAGFVASGKKDNAFVERFSSDSNLFINKFKKVIDSGSDQAKLATSLLAFALHEGTMKALDDISPMKDVESKIRSAYDKTSSDMVSGGFLGMGAGSAGKFLQKIGHKDYISRAKDIQEVFYPF